MAAAVIWVGFNNRWPREHFVTCPRNSICLISAWQVASTTSYKRKATRRMSLTSHRPQPTTPPTHLSRLTSLDSSWLGESGPQVCTPIRAAPVAALILVKAEARHQTQTQLAAVVSSRSIIQLLVIRLKTSPAHQLASKNEQRKWRQRSKILTKK